MPIMSRASPPTDLSMQGSSFPRKFDLAENKFRDSSSTLLTGGASASFNTIVGDDHHGHGGVVYMKARRRIKGFASNSNEPHEVLVRVQEYHHDGATPHNSPNKSGIKVQVASASMGWKCEDRHCVELFRNQHHNSSSSSGIQAFAGVFDGHDGPDAATYCSKGLLPHIVQETEGLDEVDDRDDAPAQGRSKESDRLVTKKSHAFMQWSAAAERQHGTSKSSGMTDDNSSDSESSEEGPTTTLEERNQILSLRADRLESGYRQAFHKAHDQFTQSGVPPTLYDVVSAKRRNEGSRSKASLSRKLKRMCGFGKGEKHKHIRPGGTTASTLSIYPGTNDPNDGPFAMIANCGDSRVLMLSSPSPEDDDRDDCAATSGRNTFRSVTRDHRVASDPDDPEVVRLLQAGGVVKNKRVYPGGLAVSRTIGDAAYSAAVICTPDVVAIDLCGSQTTTSRFLLATDGLWDSLDLVVRAASATETVHDVVTRLADRSFDPKTASTNLMEYCLKNVGCVDDITIVIVDVTV